MSDEFAQTDAAAKMSRPIVDKRRIKVVGGRGGNGLIAYKKHASHKLIGPGIPSGGGGGFGGGVCVAVRDQVTTLRHLKGCVVGERGGDGQKRMKNGKRGKDVVIEVPLGCTISEVFPSDQSTDSISEPDRTLIADLDNKQNGPITIAHGGMPGRGNNLMEPHSRTFGELGESKFVEFELKSIADVGLVGFPNAGKSTLLGAISRCCPKIAPYPFTTLAPHIGPVHYSDGYSVTVADLPGLVEGAHLNVGLGHEFLRHIERTHALVYVIDVADQLQDPFRTFQSLRHEISEYSRDLSNQPCFVVANKCDLRPKETLKRVDSLFTSIRDQYGRIAVVALSGRYGDGCAELVRVLRKVVQRSVRLQDERFLSHLQRDEISWTVDLQTPSQD